MKPDFIRKAADKLQLDRATAYAVAARIWQVLSGQVTALLIVFCLTGIEQGYYYAFLGLLGMQVFVELGLHVVLINTASHEWALLQTVDGRVEGAPQAISRLATLTRISVRWYLVAAGLFIIGVSAAGIWFFRGGTETEWAAPWLVLVLLTGLQLGLLPMTSILEGCGQLPTINHQRFWQGIAGSAVVWGLMSSGLGLWALCGSAAVRLSGEGYLALVRYRDFFVSLREQNHGDIIDWKTEIYPLQWRIAVQGTLHWFATHLAGLILFKVHGQAVAGRFGLLWTVLTALQGASLAWIDTRRPLFGRLIAERNFEELDRQFSRLSRISMTLMGLGGSLFTFGVCLLEAFPNPIFTRIAARLPEAGSTAVFSLAFMIYQAALCTNIYVRAHKQDPFLRVAVISSVTVAVLVCWLGSKYSILGTGIGYLIGVGFVQTPLWVFIWYQFRKQHHVTAEHGE